MSVVDHIIIAVEDLEKASQDYALMLGRAPSWRGTHPDYGSANTLFRLDNCYLELLAANGHWRRAIPNNNYRGETAYWRCHNQGACHASSAHAPA